jgi:dTDP-4-dehydrorhamnose reductase
MRILVTGSKGQLGTELQRRVDDTPHEFVGVDLDNGDRTLDISQRDAVLGAITTLRPDLIIHGAALTAVDLCESEPDLAYRVNALATRHIADGARRIGAHVVYVSTDYVFDGDKGSPYHEWDTPNPQSVYGRSKLGGEHELGSEFTVARTSWVCSAHGNNMVKTVLRLAGESDQTLRFVDDQYGHPTFAADLAAMVLRLAIERRPGTFHVTNQGAVSWYEFVQDILEAGGFSRDRVEPITTAEMQPPRPAKRPAFSVLDNMALRNSGIELLPDYREPLAAAAAELTR